LGSRGQRVRKIFLFKNSYLICDPGAIVGAALLSFSIAKPAADHGINIIEHAAATLIEHVEQTKRSGAAIAQDEL